LRQDGADWELAFVGRVTIVETTGDPSGGSSGIVFNPENQVIPNLEDNNQAEGLDKLENSMNAEPWKSEQKQVEEQLNPEEIKERKKQREKQKEEVKESQQVKVKDKQGQKDKKKEQQIQPEKSEEPEKNK
jgi:hypothetical protein